MSVTEDASTPAVANTAGGSALTSLTTASFSPPASTVLVAECVINWDTAPATFPAITVTDSASGTWVAGPVISSALGAAMTQIYTRAVVTAPGSMTVTMHRGSDTTNAELLCAVRVCNGAKISSPVGASNTAQGVGVGAGTSIGLPITPQAVGSLIYVTGDYSNSNTGTVNGVTTAIANVTDSVDGGTLLAGKSAVTTSTALQTLGWTANLNIGWGYVAAAIEILAGTSGAGSASTTLVGNILTVADSDFESGSPTWTATSGANAPADTNAYAFAGTHSLSWTANSTSDSIISTGFYGCKPSTAYTISGNVITPANGHDTYIGVNWYTSGHSLISTVFGNDNPSTAGMWQPLVASLTSPSNAAFFEVTVWISTAVVNNEPFAIDLMYAANVPAQVLIDWYNPAFSEGSSAGQDFVDVSPWVRWDQNLSIASGRQDAISEIQSGQATFSLQNDTGWFTPQLSKSPYYPYISLGARVQINVPDQAGNWNTRFDGAVSQITYAVDPTGNTNLASVAASDVLAYMNRQDPMGCWTLETVQANEPEYTWILNDSGNDGTALESSGNNGPVLRLVDYASGAEAPTVTWQSTNGGVETLADAVGVSTVDGSGYWVAGSFLPQSATRGLASGTVGPYETPLPSVYFKPAFIAQTSQNEFVGTDGYQLNGELYQGSVPNPIATNSASNTYTIEAWYACDPGIKANLGDKYGPFVVFSLGSGKRQSCLVAGLYYDGALLQIQLASYNEPPSFPVTSFGTAPTIIANTAATITADSVPVPHHLVVEIQGASGGGTATLYLDTVLIGTINLAAGQIYDTISVGGAYGGHGNFYGNISCVSIYYYLLSASQITTDCMVGQYGYWEQTSDNAVAALSSLSGIPSFWNNLSASNVGLSLTEYLNVSGSSPLANMQLYEAAEHGLLYINRLGQVTFHTRDWRMGYGAPDLALPADSYNASLGYELVDTFLLNESAVATTIFTTGIDWVNQVSNDTYGTYASGTAASPTQLPLITWNRSFENMGLTSYSFYQDPNLTDNASWQVNTRSTPRLTCGSLTINMATLDPSWGITIAEIYALDIDNMVTLTGMPASFPDQAGALDFFVEGINEVIGVGIHDITFYTSPASVQRAWKPGDATYGVLGTTSRIGISQPDTSVVPALGKDVAHDGGGPYWPPSFQTVPGGTQIGFTNTTAQNPTITPSTSSVQGDCLLVQVLAPVAATITVADSVNTGNYTAIGSVTLTGGVTQYLFAMFNALPLNTSATLTITTSASQNYTTSLYRLYGLSGVDTAAVTAIGTNTAPTVTGGAMTGANDLELVIITNNATEQCSIPDGFTQLWWNYNGTFQNQLFIRQATSTSFDPFAAVLGTSTAWGAIAISFTVSPFFMNNPSANGHTFLGALDMRGIRDTLAMALNPPMCVVGQVSDNQSLTTGNQQVNGRIVWDTVYVDTAGGMGIIPGWPNWYCCLVPGFYEIDVCLVWQTQSTGATGVRTGWIVVAQGAAALVALATGSPTNATYVCPVGEQLTGNNTSKNPVNAVSTRVYLGVGDMVGLAGMHTQGSTLTTGTGLGGSTMSIRWVGYNTTQDQSPIAGLPGASGVVTPSAPKTTYTKTYTATGSFSYYGTSSSFSPQLRITNGLVYQGEYFGGADAGSQFAFITFPHATIASDLSGATINSVKIRMVNQHTWYNSGGSLMVGWTTASSFGSTFTPGTGTHFDQVEVHFDEGQTLTATITGAGIGTAFQSGGATALVIGNNAATNLEYYGYWSGNTSPQLIITYSK